MKRERTEGSKPLLSPKDSEEKEEEEEEKEEGGGGGNLFRG